VCQVQISNPHHADTQGVDQRVSRVGWVEGELSTDVGQAKAVAVTPDPSHHGRHHPRSVRGIGGAEPQRVDHRDRSGAHRHDVTNDPADPGRCALVRLHIGRMVMRLDLECDRPAVADLDDTGVVPDTGEHPRPHRLSGRLPEIVQVHLGGLVGAVLTPHHRVHRQLGGRRPASQNLPDPRVLIIREAQLPVWLRLLRRGSRMLHRINRHPRSVRATPRSPLGVEVRAAVRG
jgi:hypothetical protein